MKKTIEQIQDELSKPLKGTDIELRMARMENGEAVLLAYKDARVDIRRLNEVVGIFGWTRSHEMIDGKNYCKVGIMNPDTGEFIYKQDVGTESKTEAEKGEASDAFKRACFNFGIGIELYDMPKIKVAPDPSKSYRGYGVNVAYFNDGEFRNTLAVMTITNIYGTTVFRYTHPKYVSKSQAESLKCEPSKVYVP